MDKCPVCGTESEFSERDYGDKKTITCPQCGKYEISRTFLVTIESTDVKKHLLSAYIRKQYDLGTVPFISTHTPDEVISQIEIPLVEKANTLLLSFANDAKTYTDIVDIYDEKYIARIAAKNVQEYAFVLKMLYTRGLIDAQVTKALSPPTIPYQDCKITPEGWISAESLKQTKSSNQAFVAMWFDTKMGRIWQDGIVPAFENTGFTPLRIDKKEHNEKIDDQIIAEIKRSKFLIADFTGHRGGVYFEAGYALGRGLPVIWTCKSDDLENLHFDIRQYNTIAWENEADLKERLHQRIRATIE